MRLYVIAGEASGDILGARLIGALRRLAGGSIEVFGIGGDAMESEGIRSLFPMRELSVMGLAEVLPHVLHIARRMRETAADIRRRAPDAVITIDAPGFCLGVIRRLGELNTRKIHYVAPTVWAWRPWRVRKFARLFDHLMVLLPFEPPLFENAGLATSFVGHPVIDGAAARADGAAFRAQHGIAPGVPVLCLLPGSRRGEIDRHIAPFGEATEMLAGRMGGLVVVVPTLPSIASIVREAVAGWPVETRVVETPDARFGAMAGADVALAASGTVALELAVAGTPSVIAYRLHPLTYGIVNRMVSVRYANIVNLLLDRPAIPELLQDACTGERLADAVGRLFEDAAARTAQRSAYREAIARLMPAGEANPGDAAASCVLRVIRRGECEKRS